MRSDVILRRSVERQCIFNLRTLYFCQGRRDRKVFLPNSQIGLKPPFQPAARTIKSSNRGQTPANFRRTAALKRSLKPCAILLTRETSFLGSPALYGRESIRRIVTTNEKRETAHFVFRQIEPPSKRCVDLGRGLLHHSRRRSSHLWRNNDPPRPF